MSEYIRLAKRENNNKRGFLIVNPYLGKHVPMNPIDVFKMFDKVAELKPNNMDNNKTLVIGFAETATALGIHYAIKNDTYFIQTTREQVACGKNPLYFTENHSHATEQYIVTDSIDKIMDKIDRIIFIDDEITTGNTVLNAITAINKAYSKNIKYDVISVLNGMTYEQLSAFNDKNIGVYGLEHIDNSDYESEAKLLKTDGRYRNLSKSYFTCTSARYAPSVRLDDTRLMMRGHEYGKKCCDIADELIAKLNIAGKNVLVLGTEEFMYPGLKFAESLAAKCNANVKFHATTRSPIEVGNDSTYPLHNRYELKSVYDSNRTTYLYDLDDYDTVFVITEYTYMNEYGLSTLMNTIRNKQTTVVTIHHD